MKNKAMLKLANILENIAYKIKNKIRKDVFVNFLDKYELEDGILKQKKDIRFNSYEGTSILLINELILSGEISFEDKIFDVGCGAGIFLLYLADNGYTNLKGIELDNELYQICISNVEKYKVKNKRYKQKIDIIQGNAIEMPIDDDITCFYLFNSFYDKETYMEWLALVKKSLDRNKRKIKIIILYPTVASMGAMRSCDWLHEKCRVWSKDQVCYRCVNFLIYENEE